MFKKSENIKQLGLFSSPSMVMCKRESDEIDDPMAWHNQFYKNVTSCIDEEIFRPLYVDSKMGAPTKDIRILCAMRILKEGARCNDIQLYENIRFNLVWRRALGLFDMSDQCPCITTRLDTEVSSSILCRHYHDACGSTCVDFSSTTPN